MKPHSSEISIDLKTVIQYLPILLVLGIAFWIRSNTFWLPHWRGDQSQYIALAMKLDYLGLEGYNLRRATINFLNPAVPDQQSPEGDLVYVTLAEEADEGGVLKVLKGVGQAYYDEPLHMRAPLFPYVLMWSHRLFAQHHQPYIISKANLGEGVKTKRPKLIFKSQFWAVIVPLFFNLCVIVMTYVLGKKLFNERVGIYAAFLMGTNPVGVVTAQKIWAEDLTLFFLLFSVILFSIFYPKKKMLGIFIAGIMAGGAVLVKQTAGIILVVIGLYLWLLADRKSGSVPIVLKGTLSKEFWIYTAGVMLASGFWFIKVFQTYGNPFHLPVSGMMLAQQQDTTGWFREIGMRPHPLIFFSWGVITICPLFALALMTFKKFYRQLKEGVDPKNADQWIVFLWIWILMFYFLMGQPWNLFGPNYTQEHRFLYMAYPAIALLSAVVLDQIRGWFCQWIQKPLLWEIAVIALLLAHAVWTVPIGMKVVFADKALL